MRKNNPGRRAVKKDAKVTGSRIEENKHPIIVVGVGASAGGLKSLKQLFSKMPTGRGVAFVLVQHPEPTLKSKIVKLLKDKTALAVVEATDGMLVLADCIYVIPPDKFLNIAAGRLTLQEPVLCNGLRMPIDHFFCSLAVDQRRRSIGILLSGRGGDGTLGLSEIKAAGGRTLAENPGGARHPNMARSAIDAGVVDSVLPVTGMAEAIMTLVKQMTDETLRGRTGSPDIDPDLRAVLNILRAKVGHDFCCYKPSTVIRRIRRRMSLAKITSLDDYAQFLREHPEEVGLLQKDLFIGVTDFFRQPHAWVTLAEKVIAPLVDIAQSGSDMRVWVPGCSTGNEAYSLAMLLIELVEKSGKKVNVQIFATDSDLAALATARSGIYSKEDMGENVSPERLKRFFARKDGQYQIVKDIREMVVFAPQNITADPPFSRLDLISCRNLLIYLDQQVQRKIIDLFHFSLREGGILFLGSAETVGNREELFEPVSKKWRIYRRIGVGHRVGVEIPVRLTVEPGRVAAKLPFAAPPSRMSLASGAQHMLLDRFVPACVMIDRKLQVLYVHGAVENYLTFPPGELTTRVIDMAREGLRARLRGAIAKCLESSKSVPITARVRRGDKSSPVKVVVSPLRYPREIDGLLLITFEDHRIPVAKTRGKAAEVSDTQHLMDELKITREELHSTIEQLESSNDELKASNEEVTASNEELQSANEELETSKEELQSLNEELNTINTRLSEKVEELEGVNNDVVNLLSSTNIATIFLDKDLRVKRYTPAITRLLSLIPSDAGRHIGDVLRKFSDDMLLDDSRRVLASLTPLSAEIQADDGRWYIRRILPYRTQDDRIEGVVVTFVDVAALKEAEAALRQLNAELEERVAERTAELRAASLYSRSLIEASLDPLVTISPEGMITDVNEATEQVTGRTRRELIGTNFLDYFTEPDAAQMGYRKVFADGQVRDYPLTIRHTTGGTTDVLYNATIYRNEAGEVQGVFAAARDVTALKRAEAALREANETLEQRVAERTAELAESEGRYRELVQRANSAIIRWKSDGTVTFFNEYAQNFFGYRADEVIGRHVRILVPERETTGGDLTHLVEDIVASPERYVNNINENICRDGHRVWMAWTNKPILDESGKVAEILAVGIDITARKCAEEALRERERLLRDVIDGSTSPIFLKDRDGRFITINATLEKMLGVSREEIKGKTDYDIAPKEVADYWREHDKKVMASGNAIQIEEVADLQDGHHIFLANKFPLVDVHGQTYGVGAISHDITERRQAEEALRRQSELLEHAPVLVRNLNDEIILWNSGMETMYGYSRDEALGKVSHDLLQTRHLQPFAEIISQIRNEGQWEGELHHKKKGGKDVIVTSLQMLHRDAAGNAAAIIEVNTDITERKKAEDALQTTLQRFQTLVASMHSSILLVGEGRVEMANQAFCDYFELQDSPGDLVGLTPRQLIDKIKNAYLHPEEQVARIWEIARGGQPVIGEEISMRDGRTSLRDFIPIYEDGKSYGLLWHHVDITERKQAEALLMADVAALTRMHALSGRILETGGIRPILQEVMDAAVSVVGAQRGTLQLLEGDSLRIVAHHGHQRPFLEFFASAENRASACGAAMTCGDRVTVPDVETSPLFAGTPSLAILREAGVRAVQSTPLLSRTGTVLGILTTQWDVPHSPDEHDLWRIDLLARQAADVIAYINSREELRETSDYLEKLFNYANAPIICWDIGRRITRFNHAFEDMTGYKADDVIGEDLSILFPEETRGDSLAKINRALTEYWEVVEIPVLGKDGDVRIALWNSANVYADDGKTIQATIAQGQDITERKQAEEALRDSEECFRLLSATAGRLLSSDDPQTLVEDICRDVMEYLDCQAFFNFLVDERAGRLHLNACAGIPEEDARAIEWLDYGVAVCGCVARDRTRIIAEDIFHVPDVRTDLIKSFGIQAYCCHPMMAHDHLIGTLSFGTKTRPHFTHEEVELMRTIADQVAVAMQRKRTEEAISHAKEEWERTFDAVPDLIAILDDHHRILRANKAMSERLGVTPEKCVGEACHKAVHGLDYPPDFCPHTLALDDGKEHVAEVHEDCLGGDFLVSATPLTDEQGRLIGSVHVARDITKRKQAEQILQERTAELEVLNKELESFSYSVSHDLRAPLRAIDGYARSILKKQGDKFDEDAKRRFNDIRLNARMMGQLIDDLLAFSRLGKKHMSISKLHMDAVIMDVWKELQATNPERDMKLTLDSMPAGYGDRTLIKQVCFNLLSNAVKFTKLCDPAHIEAGGYSEGNEDVYYIKDNGVGFDMAYYDKLFGVFQRLHKPDDFEGTGVGLATVQRIIHRHEGRVWAEGKVNEGATFYFSLPRKG